jgi:hypothetical protein
MRGFIKRTMIGNEIRDSMEFSLEQLQELCAVACPLHASSASSNKHFSTRATSPFSARTLRVLID